jgi:hypothetical protein
LTFFVGKADIQIMEIDEIIKMAGGPSRVAKAIGRHHSTILGWKTVPPEHVAKLAEISGIRPAEIRPDLAVLFAEPGRAA